MKAPALLFAASLVANAALVAILLRPGHGGVSFGPATLSPASSAAASPATSVAIVDAFKTGDPKSLRDLLRSAGVTDQTIRRLISSLVWSRYSDRMKALRPKPDPNQPWWKQGNQDYYKTTTREQRAEMRRLQREAADEVKQLLGPDPDSHGWNYGTLGFLPEQKRTDVQDIEQDYQDLIQETQQDMNGFPLPSDAEKIRYLMEQKHNDLAAVLTPQELADYDMRMSRTAQQLRWKMDNFEGATEDDYRKIFAIQKAFDDTQATDAWGNPIDRSPDSWQKRSEEQKKVNQEIKDALGDERYTAYMRSQNYEYKQLQAAVRRFSLPAATADSVYDLRYSVATDSARIFSNPDLSVDQKRQELGALADSTRAQIRASLGDEAAEAYMKNNASWINQVGKGQTVTFSEEGDFTGSRGLPSPPPKKTP